MVTGAFGGRVTAICTDVVDPTNTGSVPRGPPCWLSSAFDSRVSAVYHGPQVPSGRLARTRADVPVRSVPVRATIENGVG